MFSDFQGIIQLSSSSLDFSVNDTFPSQTKCLNLSFEFNDGDVCGYFNCVPRVLELNLVLLNETARVQTSNSTVNIEVPTSCACSSDSPSSTSSTSQMDYTGIITAAIVPSIFVVFAIVAILVIIIVFCRKSSKKKRIDLGE